MRMPVKGKGRRQHICKFEKPLFRIEPLLLDSGTNSLIHIFEWLNMRKKGQKKVKKILQCHVCERYQLECPYCGGKQELDELPRKTVCKQCGKEYRVEWTWI